MNMTTQLVMPNDLNPHGNLFGGTMMSWMDKIAAQFAMFYTECNCVTVKVSEVTFEKPVGLGDSVLLCASFKRRGKSSIEVGVEATRFRLKEDPVVVSSAVFKFVALKQDGTPNREWKTRLTVVPE